MTISRITVGRLYNLRNYEHVRYELTVDLTDGGKPSEAISAIENLLAGMRPVEKCGVESDLEIRRKENQLERMRKMSVAEWEQEYGDYKGTVREIIDRHEKALIEARDKRNAAIDRRKKARALFDDLGGAAKFEDAKDRWEDEW